MTSLSIGYQDAEAKALLKSLRALPAGLRREIAAVVKAGAQLVGREAKLMLGGTRARGRRTRVGPLIVVTRTGANEASAPGSPPAQQTGELRRSIRVTRARRDGLAYRVEAEFYARFLEVGAAGPGRRRLEPRPFLSVALETHRNQIEAAIATAVDRALAEAGEGAQ